MLLLTGARARSVCRLEWRDIDFEAGLIHFRVVKGERPYTVPMADRLRQVDTGAVCMTFDRPQLCHDNRRSTQEPDGG